MKVKENTKLIHKQGEHKRASFITVLPTFGMIPVEHHIATLRLANPMNAKSEIITIKGEEIADARNYAVQQILQRRVLPEFIFFYGDDMIPEWNALINLYKEAVDGQWDIISALYYMKQDGIPAPIMWREDMTDSLIEGIHYKLGEVVLSDVAGMDFTLIRPELFHKISYPYFKTGPTQNEETGSVWIHTEDSFFCRKCKIEAQLKIGVHTGVRVAHLDINTGEIF